MIETWTMWQQEALTVVLCADFEEALHHMSIDDEDRGWWRACLDASCTPRLKRGPEDSDASDTVW